MSENAKIKEDVEMKEDKPVEEEKKEEPADPFYGNDLWELSTL